MIMVQNTIILHPELVTTLTSRFCEAVGNGESDAGSPELQRLQNKAKSNTKRILRFEAISFVVGC